MIRKRLCLVTILTGLAIMVGSEAATLAHVEPFWSWNTPICWTGFILFADGVVWRARGDSWLRSAPGEFALLALTSIPLWLVFEFFNRFIRNWYYIGLPENLALRYFGYAWSFSTIWPAMFEAAELISVWRGSRPSSLRPTNRVFSRGEISSMIAGAAMLAWPLVMPSQYLAAPVWLGFIFLLDPINAAMGAESIRGDLRRQGRNRLINLLVGGLACGVIWEFWNFWARAKWIYNVPVPPHVKIFEMPVAGFAGFPPFAVECFVMYVFVRHWIWRGASRPIAL